MKNQALIYDRPSKWPIATARGTAVLIHLSAVAIAFHRDSPAAEPTGTIDFVPFGFEPADDPPIPPDPDMPLPPPSPPPTVDFIEPHKIEPSVNSHRTAARIRAAGQTRLPANGDAKACAVSTPRPNYPYEARSRHLTGSGIAIISVDPITGFATDVTMEQSSGTRFWIIPPFPPSAAGISNPVHHLEFGSRLHFS